MEISQALISAFIVVKINISIEANIALYMIS